MDYTVIILKSINACDTMSFSYKWILIARNMQLSAKKKKKALPEA